MAGMLGTIIDGVIILLLAGTMFFAMRLSMQLQNFRKGREQMDRLVKDLARHVVKAEQAITGLHEAAYEAGQELQERIGEAKALSDELQIMTQAGNNLAARLETLTEKTTSREARSTPSHKEETPFSFDIHDPDFGREEESADLGFDEEDDWGGVTGMSRTEQDLYDALQNSEKKSRAGGAS